MYDVIIVGQGIAGTVLSYTFLKNNKNILIIDELDASSASRIAGGMFNPISFKRLSLGWKVEECYSFLFPFYEELEAFTGAHFFHPVGINKIFSSFFEQNEWIKRADEPQLTKYLELKVDPTKKTTIARPFSHGNVKYAGYVNTPIMLDAYRKKMKSLQLILEEKMDYQNISNNAEGITIKTSTQELKAHKLIFCEGNQVLENPFFENLPLRPTKGEVLIIRIKEPIEDYDIVHKGGFAIKLEDCVYKIGTTYDRDDLTTVPTEQGLKTLKEISDYFFPNGYEIIEHQAGVRPTMTDRRLMIGFSNKYPNLGIFNGLGSRGIAHAPFYANEFYQSMYEEKELDKEVAMQRFKRYK